MVAASRYVLCMARNPRLIDMSGKKCGLWEVLGKAGNAPRGGAIWLCRCACGTERAILGSDLRNGKSAGCGCVGRGRIGDLKRTHGASASRLYNIWQGMRARCDRGYANYGARGITVCPEWQSFPAFQEWALGAGYVDDLSIERKDNDVGYDPGNCRWATAQEQSENRRFVARAPDGELWWHKAQRNGISQGAYRSRLSDGWPHDEAAIVPVGSRRPKRVRDEIGRFRSP